MKKLLVPQLSFGIWRAWEDRDAIRNRRYPGVYLLAITTKRLAGQRARVEDASYIGMSNNQNGLNARWGQFDRAIHGLRGHSGGNTIYADLGHYSNWKRRLFVAAVSVPCNPDDPTPKDYRLMGMVALLEYEAFAIFRRKNPEQKKPQYNKK